MPVGLEIPDLLVQVVLATAIGALIGLERERRPTRKYAGLRTLALLCGSAPVVVFVAEAADTSGAVPVLIGLYLFLALALALGVVYVRLSLQDEDIGFTTSVTVFLVALLGLLVGYEFYLEATSIAIVATILLAERDRLHGYVDSLTDAELRDSLKLGALMFVLFPILPAEPIDPYGILVLRDVLLFAILVLLIEFASYITMRQVGGSTGLAMTGLLAGGANSFAAAGVLARIGTRSRAALDAAAFALLLATASMIVRNTGIAVVLAVGVFAVIIWPALAMVVVTLASAAVLWYTGDTTEAITIDVDSPFSFVAAAKFAAAYVGILLISVGAEQTIGEAGLYASAFAGGLVSSAAVAVTAATVFNDGGVGVTGAVGMVVLGIVASLTAKIALVWAINAEMRRKAIVPLVAIGIAGVGTFLLLRLPL